MDLFTYTYVACWMFLCVCVRLWICVFLFVQLCVWRQTFQICEEADLKAYLTWYKIYCNINHWKNSISKLKYTPERVIIASKMFLLNSWDTIQFYSCYHLRLPESVKKKIFATSREMCKILSKERQRSLLLPAFLWVSFLSFFFLIAVCLCTLLNFNGRKYEGAK